MGGASLLPGFSGANLLVRWPKTGMSEVERVLLCLVGRCFCAFLRCLSLFELVIIMTSAKVNRDQKPSACGSAFSGPLRHPTQWP